ncbi:hypothetical protein NE237_015707 [Protea cynaroides]|uniref:Cystatin domain-containing protein n=1 Tax=Protea cynaroides TaxID=273540 RepID=A0A9Q0KES5_9MAGN|nr:hypothetical protein NE237_015707 [Protea cynaroides]
MKIQLSLLLTVFFIFLVSFILTTDGDGGTKTGLPGGWQAIPTKDVKKDPHVKEIAEFAVEEHNRDAKTELKYKRVVRGETQVVAGTNYRLLIAADDGGVSKKYLAVVYERPWEGFKNLTSFKQI